MISYPTTTHAQKTKKKKTGKEKGVQLIFIPFWNDAPFIKEQNEGFLSSSPLFVKSSFPSAGGCFVKRERERGYHFTSEEQKAHYVLRKQVF